MRADAHHRLRFGLHHGLQFRDAGLHRWLHCAHLFGDILQLEQALHIHRTLADVAGVDHHHLHGVQGHAAGRDVVLQGGIFHELLLHPRAALHLHGDPAIAIAHQDVQRGQHPIVLEGRFVDHRRTIGQGRLRGRQGRCIIVVWCSGVQSTPPGKRCCASSPTSVPLSKMACVPALRGGRSSGRCLYNHKALGHCLPRR
ncbi:MAG: hypothetical protein IPH60_15030 [Flavobacteriales bacterium]|nr:hypothetical protein [Flavobacteriales bacterium]